MTTERPIDGAAWTHSLRSARVRRAGQKKRIENFLALAVGENTVTGIRTGRTVRKLTVSPFPSA